jgi:hypothetical protein
VRNLNETIWEIILLLLFWRVQMRKRLVIYPFVICFDINQLNGRMWRFLFLFI